LQLTVHKTHLLLLLLLVYLLTCLNDLFSWTTWVSWHQKDDRVAMASAGPYGHHLHLASDRKLRQHLISQFLQARCSSSHLTSSVNALAYLSN